jgi:RNA polymerase sigma-70 factor (ECF subfamily)
MRKQLAGTETLLLEQARKGDAEAFSELVRMNSSRVYGISIKVLKNREDAEDNFQNVFCKAYRNIRQFHGKSKVSTWLFRIAINEALMQLRKRQASHEVAYSDAPRTEEETDEIATLPDLHSDPEKQCIAADLATKAFHGCDPALADVFVLNKAEGWTNQELASVFGMNAQTVKSRVFRAKVRLRQRVQALSQGATAAQQG